MEKDNRLCVITITRLNRLGCLLKAIESVEGQKTTQPIRHLIASEEVEDLARKVLSFRPQTRVSWLRLPELSHIRFSSARLARLRSLAVEHVAEPWVAFLDDDNRLEPNHYRELLSLIRHDKLQAAHSWRRLIEPDGTPFHGQRYPWAFSEERAAHLWQWCVKHGVITLGSSIIRDGPIDDPSPFNVATVDMNEWLLSTDLVRNIGFQLEYDEVEEANQVGEDDTLLVRLKKAGVSIGCTRKATVIYSLGGCSNGFQTEKIRA